MKTILVPTDFSNAAANAANFAAALCRKMNARLVLFHSFMLPVPVSEVPFVMVTADELQKTSEGSIKKEAERIFAETGIEVEWLVRLGLPYEEIKDLEKEREVDLVVMGMKGAGGLKWMGSTTTAVVRKFDKPVLVIPEAGKFSEIKTVTYATDFNADMNLACFEAMLTLIRTFNANLQVVNIRKNSKGMTAAENAGKSRLEAIWGDVPHEYFSIDAANPEEGIQQFTREHATDMLVIVAHQHSFLERLFGDHVTKDLAIKTQIPLLILHG